MTRQVSPTENQPFSEQYIFAMMMRKNFIDCKFRDVKYEKL